MGLAGFPDGAGDLHFLVQEAKLEEAVGGGLLACNDLIRDRKDAKLGAADGPSVPIKFTTVATVGTCDTWTSAWCIAFSRCTIVPISAQDR